MTVGRVIAVRRGRERSPYLLHHELVHVRQWRRHGTVGFLARYTGSYLRWRVRGYPHASAYRRIRFEIEADWIARRIVRTEHAPITHEPSTTG